MNKNYKFGLWKVTKIVLEIIKIIQKINGKEKEQ